MDVTNQEAAEYSHFLKEVYDDENMTIENIDKVDKGVYEGTVRFNIPYFDGVDEKGKLDKVYEQIRFDYQIEDHDLPENEYDLEPKPIYISDAIQAVLDDEARLDEEGYIKEEEAYLDNSVLNWSKGYRGKP